MANKISIRKLTNANVYVDGGSQLGRASEVTLPQIKTTAADHQSLGMVGVVEYPSGLDKMAMNIKWNTLDQDIVKKVANPYQAINFQIRSSLERYEGGTRTEQTAVVCYVTGRCNDFPLGSYKPAQNAEFDSNVAVSYIKLEVGGEVLVEVDVEANIYKVGGVDLLAEYRANLGID